MKKDSTELVFILDRSGSMAGKTEDTVGGFNTMIEKQKQVEGDCLVSLVVFDHVSDVVYDRVPLKDVRPLTYDDCAPRGSTALLDAVGGAIHHIGNVHKYAREEDRPEHTLVVITTDGHENSSLHYDRDKVLSMVKRQREKYNWEFLFMGADLESVEAAVSIGIPREYSEVYRDDKIGRAMSMACMADAVYSMRARGEISKNWNEKLERDKKRK